MKKQEPSLHEQTIMRVLGCLLVLAIVVWWLNSGPSTRSNNQSGQQTADWVVIGAGFAESFKLRADLFYSFR